jgi:hypothetical protein
VAVALLAALIVCMMTAVVITIIAFLRSEAGSLPVLLHKIADILERAKTALPVRIYAIRGRRVRPNVTSI